MARTRAEMSLVAVPVSTAGNENSRVHATINQELKTLADAMFQFAEADGDQPQVSSIEKDNRSAQEDTDPINAGCC